MIFSMTSESVQRNPHTSATQRRPQRNIPVLPSSFPLGEQSESRFRASKVRWHSIIRIRFRNFSSIIFFDISFSLHISPGATIVPFQQWVRRRQNRGCQRQRNRGSGGFIPGESIVTKSLSPHSQIIPRFEKMSAEMNSRLNNLLSFLQNVTSPKMTFDLHQPLPLNDLLPKNKRSFYRLACTRNNWQVDQN